MLIIFIFIFIHFQLLEKSHLTVALIVAKCIVCCKNLLKNGIPANMVDTAKIFNGSGLFVLDKIFSESCFKIWGCKLQLNRL